MLLEGYCQERVAVARILDMKTTDKVRKLCEDAGLNQAALAKVAKVSKSTANNWWNGSGGPDARAALRIAQHFDVPLEWLVDEDQDGPPPPRPSEAERAVLGAYKASGLTVEAMIELLFWLARREAEMARSVETGQPAGGARIELPDHANGLDKPGVDRDDRPARRR